MIDNNTKKCNFVKRVVKIIVSIIAITISQILAEKFFDGSIVFILITMVIILAVMTPIGIAAERRIEAYYDNKR